MKRVFFGVLCAISANAFAEPPIGGTFTCSRQLIQGAFEQGNRSCRAGQESEGPTLPEGMPLECAVFVQKSFLRGRENCQFESTAVGTHERTFTCHAACEFQVLSYRGGCRPLGRLETLLGRPQDCIPDNYTLDLRYLPIVVTSDPERAYQTMVEDCLAMGYRRQARLVPPRRAGVVSSYGDICSPTDFTPATNPRLK